MGRKRRDIRLIEVTRPDPGALAVGIGARVLERIAQKEKAAQVGLGGFLKKRGILTDAERMVQNDSLKL